MCGITHIFKTKRMINNARNAVEENISEYVIRIKHCNKHKQPNGFFSLFRLQISCPGHGVSTTAIMNKIQNILTRIICDYFIFFTRWLFLFFPFSVRSRIAFFSCLWSRYALNINICCSNLWFYVVLVQKQQQQKKM